MEKFVTVKSRVLPLPMKDVDTDMIIPATFMTSVSREGYGENVFRRLRDNDPNFPFNLEKYKNCQIMVVDENFACGSSREHAVWALSSWGLKVIISKSFADIFYSNSAKNGLVLVTLPPAIVDQILIDADNSNYEVEVDLERQIVKLPDGKECKFDFDSFSKHCILNGLDDLDYLMSHKTDIDAFRESKKSSYFFSIN